MINLRRAWAALGLSTIFLGGLAAEATEYGFATVEQGREILTADDLYIKSMGATEIAIRLGRTDPAGVDTVQLKAQYREGVLEWTAAEKAKIDAILTAQAGQLAKVAHLLPDSVLFIKVNKLVDGGLPHTRANAIVFPTHSLESAPEQLTSLFYHELFHVLSRAQRAKHNSLFALVGFQPCHIDLPKSLTETRLTNPDAPTNKHYVPVTLDGKPKGVVPFLYATRPAFDPELEGGFGAHFKMKLAVVDVAGGHCPAVLDKDGAALTMAPADVPDYGQAIGGNTGYIIHPEEILADNFAYLMLGRTDLPNPEIPEKLDAWINQ